MKMSQRQLHPAASWLPFSTYLYLDFHLLCSKTKLKEHSREICYTFGGQTLLPARKIWFTLIQAYMPYESSEDSSNQLDGPMGPWIGIKDQVTDLFRPICPCWYLILDNIIWKYILYPVTLFLDKDLFAYGTPPEKKLFLGRSSLKGAEYEMCSDFEPLLLSIWMV